MPTAEMIAIDCAEIPHLPRYPSFSYRIETRLESDRALFQSVFDRLNGIIIHLANRDLEGEDACWFAGAIMDWTQNHENGEICLSFLPETRSDVFDLMQRLLSASPRHRITFSTDYQFGGERRECGEVTLAEFFDRHDRCLLHYNELYYIRPDDLQACSVRLSSSIP